MSETVLLAETGRAKGSANSRRLRREERIPAVVYGQGMDPLAISVARSDLRVALSGSAGMNTVLDLTVDGTVFPAIVREMQRHPVRRTVQHVDFIQVNLDEEISINVPVHLEGHAKAVSDQGGLVDLAMAEVEVRTTPRNIPDAIVIDITELTMDSVITLGDITLPDGVVATGDDDWAVVTVLAMSTEPTEEEEAEAVEGEAAEGEEAAAEGEAAADAPAADADAE